MSGRETEERLREALGMFADQVQAPPDAFRRVQGSWRRRERRRRIAVAVAAAILVGLADVLGLWALGHARTSSPVIFGGPPPVSIPARTP
ncbi:MAG: hypothetical protein ACYCU5_13735 [Actinomycetes bacterium]